MHKMRLLSRLVAASGFRRADSGGNGSSSSSSSSSSSLAVVVVVTGDWLNGHWGCFNVRPRIDAWSPSLARDGRVAQDRLMIQAGVSQC